MTPDPVEQERGLRIARFEDTGEERAVIAWCLRCRVTPDDWPEVVVSPRGTAHHSNCFGSTQCGLDATGEDWWWKL